MTQDAHALANLIAESYGCSLRTRDLGIGFGYVFKFITRKAAQDANLEARLLSEGTGARVDAIRLDRTTLVWEFVIY